MHTDYGKTWVNEIKQGQVEREEIQKSILRENSHRHNIASTDAPREQLSVSRTVETEKQPLSTEPTAKESSRERADKGQGRSLYTYKQQGRRGRSKNGMF